jgi:KUP system potassium uptake protein
LLKRAVAILIALFAIQSQGTARIGRAFGPVMAAWFVTIALLGVWGITKHPAVLLGLDPRYAISYLAHDGFKGLQCWAASSYVSPAPRRCTPTTLSAWVRF